MRLPTVLGAALVCLATAPMITAQPVVANPSFEEDAFTSGVGLAVQNGGRIAGWEWEGNVGINPLQPGAPGKGQGDPSPFFDNGIVPHGRQVVLMQNCAVLRQSVPGFVAGRTYRVTFRANARHNQAPERRPRLKVLLGGECVVSEHDVVAVDAAGARTLPFARVESAPFTAPADGRHVLQFETTFADRVTVLLDDVRIVPVPAPAARPQ